MSGWFGRRRKSGSEATFRHAAEGDQLVVWLEDNGRRVPTSDWVSAKPEVASALTLLQLESEEDAGEDESSCEFRADDVWLPPQLVARLDAATAAILSLPPATSLALELKPQGIISNPDFTLAARWIRPGGQPVRAELQGAILKSSDGVSRVPEPLWSLWRSAQPLLQPHDASERFRALAELRRHWPEDPRAPVESESYLRDLRVHYASSASLKLNALTPEQTDFDPVLFGAHSLAEAQEDGHAPDEELDSVLAPSTQNLFASDRFRREPDARPVYVLRDGEYIYIDPALRPVLGEIRRMQDRPEAERRAFVLNPRQVLRERLGEALAETCDLDVLFVETEQFSSRVAGVDVWRAQVLPWLTPLGKNQWIPERFGLRVGDDYFVVPPDNIVPLIKRAEGAAEAGQTTFDVGGLLEPPPGQTAPAPTALPATDQTLRSIRALAPFAGGVAPDGEEAGAATDDPRYPDGKLFLVVRENFEEVEFAPVSGEAAVDFRPIDPPERLHTQLKEHQLLGLNWLAECVVAGRPGALLADDMGLGKTLQAIAFMAWLQDEASQGRRESAPFLIVAPTALLGTWRDEIVKHLDLPRLGPLVPAFGANLKVLREDSGLSARDIETGRAALRGEAWRDAGVVLTTYETMRDYHFSFARTRFGLVIYDEIQKLKNPTSQMTRAARALNSSFTLGMTGTPVENRLQDLWSLMDVIAPGLLGASRDFEARHPANDPEALRRLKAQMMDSAPGRPAYMLRRLKADELEGLPQKHITTFAVEMPEVQADAYRDVVVRAAAGASAGTIGRGGMLSTLAEMRGISLHPQDPRQAPTDLEAYAQDSARLSKTLEILTEISAKGEKALIFVEDLAMQERLAGLIRDRFRLAELPARIHGGVPGPRRQALVTAFQQRRPGFDVMILSPKAGGVGLTLTAANHVIHLSRWWNPAVEDQATDRVFRIGQTRDVHVHVPMAVHPDPAIRESSFDLRLNALIERKRQLTRDLFLPPEPSDADLAGLFREVSLGPDEDAATPETTDASETAPVEVAERSDVESAPARATMHLPRPLEQTGVRFWNVRAGEPRPLEEIIDLFGGRDIEQIEIRDPYALCHTNARRAQVEFIARLKGVCRTFEAAVLEYAPDADGDLPEPAARRDIGELFSRFVPDHAPRLVLRRRDRRGRNDDFHDRTIEVSVRHAGGAVRRHLLSIGRGAEALFNDRWQCTVTYVPPSHLE
ncbi:DEAD/DEAH box helicase [Phenylobacterium sp.]|uniref:DEAD/DEAH box helicase n=1 Tax=Phenylobacterium sp. TaxID=1871053 RepID=UPI0035AFE937